MTDERTYAITSIFDTLAGEGARSGQRSLFLRFAGCNYWNGEAVDREKGLGACAHFCDTDFRMRERLTASEIVARLEALWPRANVNEPRWVVCTGGEPFLHFDLVLAQAMRKAGFWIAVETNGSRKQPFVVRWMAVSPKLSVDGTSLLLAITKGDECKIAIGGTPDWTDVQLETLHAATAFDHYFVVPIDPAAPNDVGLTYLGGAVDTGYARYDAAVKRCLDIAKRDTRWRVGAQLHKYLGIP